MQINTQLWNSVVAAAKKAAANSPTWLRAIAKADAQVQSNPCITELASGVLITSPSGRTYLANGVCQCEAYKHGMACWHRAAAQLIARYNEAVTQAATSPAPAKPADERQSLIGAIQQTWAQRFPGESLADNLMARFATNTLNSLNADFLHRVYAAITR